MAAQRPAGRPGNPQGGAIGRRRYGNSGDPSPGLLEATEDAQSGERGEPDVLLDVPRLAVEEIALEVENLHARISLEARLADLVQLHVGADVRVERVALEIKGVEAQAQLTARLDRVLAIIERALDTVDKNPELLAELSRSVQDAAGGLGDAVGQTGETAGELAEGATEAGEQAGHVVEGTADDLDDTASGAGRSSRARGDRGKSASRRKAGASGS